MTEADTGTTNGTGQTYEAFLADTTVDESVKQFVMTLHSLLEGSNAAALDTQNIYLTRWLETVATQNDDASWQARSVLTHKGHIMEDGTVATQSETQFLNQLIPYAPVRIQETKMTMTATAPDGLPLEVTLLLSGQPGAAPHVVLSSSS